MNNSGEMVSFIQTVAALLRVLYEGAQHGRALVPLTVHRCIDCMLAEVVA